jgi:hypothetical protein
MMDTIVGKWIQEAGQPYAGLWFEFKADGSFSARYDAMSIDSGGTYRTEGKQIDMDQTSHTFGLVGSFKGLYEIDGRVLKLALAGGPQQPRPGNLDDARRYLKED